MAGVAFGKTNASVLLDLLRGTAALLVVFEHWRNALYVDYPQVTAHRGMHAIFYSLSSAGHQAVVVFFVLSGFLVGGSVIRMLKRGSWSWRAYAIHRLTRLWIVLLPGLLLCLAWDFIRIHLTHGPGSSTAMGALYLDANRIGSAREFIGNVLFLQTIRVHTFGSDTPLWSLANEF